MEQFRTLSDSALLSRLKELAAVERSALADFLACLAEVDRRSAVLPVGFGSLFHHCVAELKMSEGAAFIRIRAARAANRFPELYSLIKDGLVNLTNLSLVFDHLKSRPDLIGSIQGKSRLDVERLLALIAPKPEPRDSIRVLSVPAQALQPPIVLQSNDDGQQTVLGIEPVSPAQAGSDEPDARLEFKFAASHEFLEAVEKLRALLWHKYPKGRLEDLLLEAAREFIARRDPSRPRRTCGRSDSPSPSPPCSPKDSPSPPLEQPELLSPGPPLRRIPAAVAREVMLRDGQRCAFVSGAGRRCAETRGLELDHIKPWARGGRSDDAGNVRLLCRAHNQWEAIQAFGEKRCKR